MIGLKREPSGALKDVPENQLARDSLHETVVETKSFGDARGADRVRRTEDDSDHPPLCPAELDVDSEILEPFSANLSCAARNHLDRHGVIVGEAVVPGFCSRCVRCKNRSHKFIIAWSSPLP